MTSSPGCTVARIAVRMACVAPAVTVISLSRHSCGRRAGRARRPACRRWPRAGPARRSSAGTGSGRRAIASETAATRRGSQSKSGKPWPRLTAPFSAASADITVKMVVPTWGSRAGEGGGAAQFLGGSTRVSPSGAAQRQFVVVDLAGHGAGHQVAVQPVAEQFGKLEHEVAQVGAALEGDAGDVLAEQVAGRAHDQPALAFVVGHVAHRHFGHDAHAHAQRT
jgi:hypothetical protein